MTSKVCTAAALLPSWPCLGRALVIDSSFDQQMETFRRMRRRALEFLGRVPRQIVYDSLRSVVPLRVGATAQFTPRFWALAGHYLLETVAAPVPPQDPPCQRYPPAGLPAWPRCPRHHRRRPGQPSGGCAIQKHAPPQALCVVSYDLVLVDELGCLDFDARGADLLYQVFNRRYLCCRCLGCGNIFPKDKEITKEGSMR
jgi:hypothetical protein